MKLKKTIPGSAIFTAATFALCFLTSSELLAECEQWSEKWESKQLIIGDIEIQAGNIFDESYEDQGLMIHRTANRLHMKTRDQVIGALADVEKHDEYTEEKLADIERRLRSMKFIRDANAKPVAVCDNKVNIQITTIDNWTLTPSISFGTAGGESKLGFDIKESNFLGSGTELRLSLDRKNGEDIYGFGYSDPVFLSRTQSLTLGYSRSNSRESSGIRFTRGKRHRGWRWKASYDDSAELVSQQSNQFNRQFTTLNLEALHPLSEVLSLGISVEDVSDSIEPISPDQIEFGTYQRSNTSINALLELNFLSYKEVLNYKSVDQIEDLGLGSTLRFSAGIVRQHVGNGSGFGASVAYQYGTYLGSSIFTGSIGASHVSDGHQTIENLNGHLEWIAPLGQSSRFRLRTDAQSLAGYSFADNLDIGGENGLKGYPNQHQTGTQRMLFLAEYRRDLPFRIWNLGRLGMTIFAESGRAWKAETEKAQPWLGNLGAGLVFSPSRSSSTNLVRMELAAPISDQEELAPVQLFIGAESKF